MIIPIFTLLLYFKNGVYTSIKHEAIFKDKQSCEEAKQDIIKELPKSLDIIAVCYKAKRIDITR